MGLRFPTGIRPDDLSNPVPGVEQQQFAAEQATEQLSQLEPVRAPASEPSADTQGLLQEFANFSPEAQALAAEFSGGQAPAALSRPSPELRPAQSFLGEAFNLVQKPDGAYAVRNPDGTLRTLEPTEVEQLQNAAKILGYAPAAASIATGAVTFGLGPVTSAALASGAGEAVDAATLASRQEAQAATGQTPEAAPSLGQRAGRVAAGTAMGGIAARAAQTFNQVGLQRVGGPAAEVAGEAALYRGAAEMSRQGVQAAEDLQNVPREILLPEQINVADPEVRQLATRVASGDFGPAAQVERQAKIAAQQSYIQDEVKGLLARFPELSPENLERASPRTVVQSLLTETPKSINRGNKLASDIAGSKRFPVSDLYEQFKEARRGLLRNDAPQGALDDLDRAWLDFQQESSASGDIAGLMGGNTGRGLTLDQLNRLTRSYQDMANFGARERTPAQRALGRIASEARLARDAALEQAVATRNPELAAQIRQDRLFWASKVDALEKVQTRLAQDPDNYTRVILRKDAPLEVKTVFEALPEESRGLIRRQHLENAIGDVEDFAKGSYMARAEKNFMAPGESALEIAYGADALKDLKTFFRAMRRLESQSYTNVKDVKGSAAARAVMSLLKKKPIAALGDIKELVVDGLTKNKQAQRYFSQELLEPSSPQRILQQMDRLPVDNSTQQQQAADVIGSLIRTGAIRSSSGAGAAGGAKLSDLLLSIGQQPKSKESQ